MSRIGYDYVNDNNIDWVQRIINKCEDTYNIGYDNLNEWLIPMSQFKELIHPVYYNGEELPFNIFIFKGLLYKLVDGKIEPLKLYSGKRIKKPSYRIYMNGRIGTINLGSIIKQNYPIPCDFHLHHLNHNHMDNRPSNLVMLDPVIHNSYHAKINCRLKHKRQFFQQYGVNID